MTKLRAVCSISYSVARYLSSISKLRPIALVAASTLWPFAWAASGTDLTLLHVFSYKHWSGQWHGHTSPNPKYCDHISPRCFVSYHSA